MKKQKRFINVQGSKIDIISTQTEDFISLTDMIKAKDGEFFISDWLRNRNTIEFLGVWERIYNNNFNYGEFAIIKSQAGLNSYRLSVKEWIEKTSAIGIRASAGRYGGTYAHKDIAFEFGMWISPEFKIYLIREFQRLKEEEAKSLSQEWSISRMLSKINYQIHSEAIKTHLIPDKLSLKQVSNIYASEADVLNLALFGCTAGDWKSVNPSRNGNLRDHAEIAQLICLSNLENLNALFIAQGFEQKMRLQKLNEIAIKQMTILTQDERIKKIGGV